MNGRKIPQLTFKDESMKYYEMHDEVYKGLRQRGMVTWDGQVDVESIYEHHINLELNKNISKYFPKAKGKSALDLGTGSGTAALFLARKGFLATGYDISSEAIQLAKENALKLDVQANFQVQDICEYSGNNKFDLVVDSSFLHCIVHNEERSHIYSAIRNILKSEGYLFIHTMIAAQDMSDLLSKEHILLEKDILWSTGKDSWDMEWKVVDGKRVFPHRRILSQVDLEEELSAHQFKVVDKVVKLNERGPSTYIAWLRVNHE